MGLGNFGNVFTYLWETSKTYIMKIKSRSPDILLAVDCSLHPSIVSADCTESSNCVTDAKEKSCHF